MPNDPQQLTFHIGNEVLILVLLVVALLAAILGAVYDASDKPPTRLDKKDDGSYPPRFGPW